MGNDLYKDGLGPKELARMPFFYIFSREDLEILSHIVTVKNFGANRYIVKEGDEQSEMYFILQGKVSVLKKDYQGNEDVLAELVYPHIFGEMALVSGGLRSASIKSITDIIVAEVTCENFESLIESQPKLALKFIRRIADTINSKLQKLNINYVDSI